jgi:hypothetical protein
MGLELRNRLQAALRQSLPATLIWTFPTVERLAAHLIEQWRAANPQDPIDAPITPPPATEPSPEADDLLADFDSALADIDRLVRS